MNKLDITTHAAALMASRSTEKFLLILEAAGLAKSLVRMPDWNDDGTVVAVVDSKNAWLQLTEADRESREFHAVDLPDLERLPSSHKRFREYRSFGQSQVVLSGHCKVSGVKIELCRSLPLVTAGFRTEEEVASLVENHCVPQGIHVSLADRGDKWWTVEEYEHDCVLIDTFMSTSEWDGYELSMKTRVIGGDDFGGMHKANVEVQAVCRELKSGLLLATFVPFEEQTAK